MAHDMKTPEADALAHEIARLTGDSPAAVVLDALRRHRADPAHARTVATALERAMTASRRTAAYATPRHADVDAFYAAEDARSR